MAENHPHDTSHEQSWTLAGATSRSGGASRNPSGASTTEERIAAIAARQHGLVTRAQLLAAGLARDAVQYRVKCRRLRPVQQAVYRLGPLVAPLEPEMAAVLACGPRSAISHWSAGTLWRVRPREGGALVDVTLPFADRRKRPHVRVHRTRQLEPDEVTTFEGIAVTTPARTLVDLSGCLRPRELEQTLARAERLELVSAEELAALIARRPRRRGIPELRSLLAPNGRPALTRSEAEERLLALVRKAQLPPPETNTRFSGFEVDFLWRAERLVVEVDGFAFHSSANRFEQDRLRDARLAAKGLRVMRVTWRQLEREPVAVAARLAQTLALATSRA